VCALSTQYDSAIEAGMFSDGYQCDSGHRSLFTFSMQAEERYYFG
jgi:hypothetical protein